MASNNNADLVVAMSEQFPDYSTNYEMVSSQFVFPGLSSDYPWIAWSASRTAKRAYLIPSSLTCRCSMKHASKAFRNKECDIRIGSVVKVFVSTDPADPVAKAVDHDLDSSQHFLRFDGHDIVTYCILSDVGKPRCYAKPFGWVDISAEIRLALGKNWFARTVYEGRINFSFSWKKDELGQITQLQGHFYQLHKLTKLIYPSESDMIKRLYNALIVSSGVKKWGEGSTVLRTERNVNPFETVKKGPPPLGAHAKLTQTLWCFEDGRVLYPDRPRALVRLSRGMTVEQWRAGFFSIEPNYARHSLPLPDIEDGQRITGNLWRNGLNDFYLVMNYVIAADYKAEEEPAEEYNFKLPKRIVGVGFSNQENQYLVNVNRSIFMDFFVCAQQLGHILIFDPRRILRNALPSAHRDGFPVWIHLERDELRLAPFTVRALGVTSSASPYLKCERSDRHPDIHGHGILVDGPSGAVFSADHPQTGIRLAPIDRMRFTVGEQFTFAATFQSHRMGFLVATIRRLDEDEDSFKEFDTFRKDDLVLFKQTMKTRMRQWVAEGHDSADFGPVVDPQGLYLQYLIDNNIDNNSLPEEFDAFVCFNRDWLAGKDTQMMVHSLAIGAAPAELEEFVPVAPLYSIPPNWGLIPPPSAEEDAVEDVYDVCDGCLAAWGILRDVLEAIEAATENGNNIEPALVDRLAQAKAALDFVARQRRD